MFFKSNLREIIWMSSHKISSIKNSLFITTTHHRFIKFCFQCSLLIFFFYHHHQEKNEIIQNLNLKNKMSSRRSPSPQQQNQQQSAGYGSPETMLSRRFQTLRPSHLSQKSETNKLIASMTMRSLVMSSGTSQLYRRSLENDHIAPPPNPDATPRSGGGGGSKTTPKTPSNNNNTATGPITKDVQNVFYATLASLKTNSFEKQLILKVYTYQMTHNLYLKGEILVLTGRT